MTSEAKHAQAKQLTLLLADNSTGSFGVTHRSGKLKPYQVQVTRGGKSVCLGSFATAEEAALYVARSQVSADGVPRLGLGLGLGLGYTPNPNPNPDRR